MSPLSPRSLRALAALRAFRPPPTNYPLLPLTRRAAVLILLFADPAGDLRVVLTIRSLGLRNYSGHAALPGGKADTLAETPWQTARREAWEEIGLPLDSSDGGSVLPKGYEVEELTELPTNLAMTELGVRPCVAFLRTPEGGGADVGRDLLPKLDAKEVAAVFTAPVHNLLCERDEDAGVRESVPGEWYKGSWHSWHETAWRMHQFMVPVSPGTVFLASSNTAAAAKTVTDAAAPSKPKPKPPPPPDSALAPPLPRAFYVGSPDPLQQPRYRVFGMTARILVDCARVAYGEEPEFEHNSHFGDEEMIASLLRIGRLGKEKKVGEMLTREVMMKAGKPKM